MFNRIGTVTHGTLRTQDLLEALADELEFLIKKEGHPGNSQTLGELVNEARLIDWDSEQAQELVDELVDALNEYAPPYIYFGCHAGDGSDFGFWPDLDLIEMDKADGELQVIDAGDEPPMGAVMAVNDHGNITMYVNRVPIWDCV